MNCHIEKGILPVLPGDKVYWVNKDSYIMYTLKVKGVTLAEDQQLYVQVVKQHGGFELGKDVFLTADEAEEYVAKIRPVPPFPFRDRAVKWMPVNTWEPPKEDYYGIKILKDDGTEQYEIAYFKGIWTNTDERGFYKHCGCCAPRMENVVAWIDRYCMDTDGWYDGKPLDFCYYPIEELDLRIQTFNALKGSGLHTIRDILQIPDKAGLMKILNKNRKDYEEIIHKLELYGFKVDCLK